MIGFPKQVKDFKSHFYKNKAWEKSFNKKREAYLNSSQLIEDKTKDWRFFPFHKILSSEFDFNSKCIEIENLKAQLKDSIVIQIKNGDIVSYENEKFQVVSWTDFLEGKKQLPSSFTDKIFKSFNQQRNHLSCLNHIFYPRGFILIFKKAIRSAVEIHYLQDSLASKQALNLRNFIFIEKSARVLEFFHTRKSQKPLFLNIQTDCFLKEKTSLEYFAFDNMKEQDTIVHQMFSYLKKESKASFLNLSLNVGLSRWFKYVEQEEKSESKLRGLSLMSGKSHTDHKTTVKHKGLRGQSEQFFKSFLFDSARYVFQGLISIEKTADESETKQLNKNYLFSSKSSALSFPELDVCPANVKAEHGSTTSSFFERNPLLFYLKSRGIDSFLSFHLVLLSLLKETFSDCSKDMQSLIHKYLERQLALLEESLNQDKKNEK
ncbi:MAG: SufD family Fe-S cluster assembly protein [Bdellovibrionales bacterium]|nr:SufD family Fe-S cluster assembly protein [Bdellovibrionales bacterium]